MGSKALRRSDAEKYGRSQYHVGTYCVNFFAIACKTCTYRPKDGQGNPSLASMVNNGSTFFCDLVPPNYELQKATSSVVVTIAKVRHDQRADASFHGLAGSGSPGSVLCMH